MSYLTIDGMEDYFPSSVNISSPVGKSFISIDISLSALPKCDNIRLYLSSGTGRLRDAEVVQSSSSDMWNIRGYNDDVVQENADTVYNIDGYVPGHPETLPVIETPRLKKSTKRKSKKSSDKVSEDDAVNMSDIVVDVLETPQCEHSEAEYMTDIELQDECLEISVPKNEEDFVCEICSSDLVDDEYGAYDESDVPEFEDEYAIDSNEDVSEDENDISDDVAESDEKTKKKKKSLKKTKAPKVKYARQTGRLVSQIATPTCTGNVAPTLMATGYGTATYKNLYSVGHFPKLGVFEVWEDDEVSTEKSVETVHYEREMNVDINESESGVIDAGSIITHNEPDMVVDVNVTEDDKKKYTYVMSDVNSGDVIRDKFGIIKNGFGSEPLF